LEEMSNN